MYALEWLLMGIACVIDAEGCEVCPAIAGSPGVPAYTTITPVVGWNAGANSASRLNNTIRAKNIQVPHGTTGVVVGFKPDYAGVDQEAQVINPTLVKHGLYFRAVGGLNFVSVMERGIEKIAAFSYTFGDLFTIQRVGGVVSYLQNATKFYTSLLPSEGPQLVNACLYLSGDSVL